MSQVYEPCFFVVAELLVDQLVIDELLEVGETMLGGRNDGKLRVESSVEQVVILAGGDVASRRDIAFRPRNLIEKRVFSGCMGRHVASRNWVSPAALLVPAFEFGFHCPFGNLAASALMRAANAAASMSVIC